MKLPNSGSLGPTARTAPQCHHRSAGKSAVRCARPKGHRQPHRSAGGWAWYDLAPGVLEESRQDRHEQRLDAAYTERTEARDLEHG